MRFHFSPRNRLSNVQDIKFLKIAPLPKFCLMNIFIIRYHPRPLSVGFCRGSRVEGKMSRVEGKMSRVEGKMSRVESKMSRVQKCR